MTKRPNTGGHGARKEQNKIDTRILLFPPSTPQQENKRPMLKCARAWRSEADWRLVYAHRELLRQSGFGAEVIRL